MALIDLAAAAMARGLAMRYDDYII